MPIVARTERQSLGDWGEKKVSELCFCPSCKRSKTMKLLPPNFKCADLICDFCGYLSQVKTCTVVDVNSIPRQILGAAWEPQRERMEAAIYFSLYLVLSLKDRSDFSIYFLSKDLQEDAMFVPRKPLSSAAKRAGWQGYLLQLDNVKGRFVRLFWSAGQNLASLGQSH
ncbi:DpnI domain-containing protein [Azospirillum argentinense]|uniref:DpnI domain-containing protein n=1 Tax=Azospirillum argentinense TaxID=2970906 RepID=UPI0027E3AB4F|nr:DpnI domain-containing protein [Azospirillum argentinense]